MSNKIIVEFDRKELKQKCKNLQHYPNNWCYCGCEKKDEDLIDCVMRQGLNCEYKIKEQNNGNKGTENKEIKERI